MTLDEVLQELGISRSTWHDWRAKGRAPRCLKLPNGSIRIRHSDYLAFLDTCTEDGEA